MPSWSAPALWGIVLPLSALVTWLARGYALRRALLDVPGERRSHAAATPRGGGLGIAIAAAFGFLCLAIWPASARWPALAGLLLVAGIGWLDDHRPVAAGWRLLAQGLAGLCLAWAAQVAGLPWPWLAVVAVPVLVNVWNFMDGIDGIATSQAALVALGGLFLLPAGGAHGLAWLVLLASVGFLPFNLLPRLKVFLGDVGSYALGYLLAALLMGATQHVPSPLLLLPVSAFVLDAALTLGLRMLRGERWWQPHRVHLYQRLAQRWEGHLPVTLLYAGWTVACTLAMILLLDASVVTQGVSTLVAYILGAIAWWWLGSGTRGPQGSALQ